MRGRPRTIDHDTILNAWARPKGPTAADLAREHGVTEPCIKAIVQRARKRGDPRAVERPKNYRPGGTFTAFFLSCRDAGMTVETMASFTGRKRRGVKHFLRVIDRNARREMQDAGRQGSLA